MLELGLNPHFTTRLCDCGNVPEHLGVSVSSHCKASKWELNEQTLSPKHDDWYRNGSLTIVVSQYYYFYSAFEVPKPPVCRDWVSNGPFKLLRPFLFVWLSQSNWLKSNLAYMGKMVKILFCFSIRIFFSKNKNKREQKIINTFIQRKVNLLLSPTLMLHLHVRGATIHWDGLVQ